MRLFQFAIVMVDELFQLTKLVRGVRCAIPSYRYIAFPGQLAQDYFQVAAQQRQVGPSLGGRFVLLQHFLDNQVDNRIATRKLYVRTRMKRLKERKSRQIGFLLAHLVKGRNKEEKVPICFW